MSHVSTHAGLTRSESASWFVVRVLGYDEDGAAVGSRFTVEACDHVEALDAARECAEDCGWCELDLSTPTAVRRAA